MPLTSESIDRIVANVLSQISAKATGASSHSAQEKRPPQKTKSSSEPIVLQESVITAEVVESLPADCFVSVHRKAIITPAARDAIKARRVTVTRAEGNSTEKSTGAATSPVSSSSIGSPLLLVVRNTFAVDQLWDELKGTWKRDLQSCPDDAARLAISSLCRGETPLAVIFAEQTHRAACLANRNDKVKAVAVREVSEIKQIRKQLRANVWCVDPSGRTYFELKNLLRQIQSAGA